ncbi:MAG: thiol reductant ABC exporter subunit CydC [Gaiellales bacterium]
MIGRLVDLSGVSRPRLAVVVSLGAVATSLGIALIATSGYLISRAAQRPPVLALTVTIVIVRFLGLTRPLARYLDRLVSHDLALRSLGTIRSRFFARIEPLAPGQLDGFRRGDLVARMVGDVDRLDGLYVRGLCPPLSGLAVAVLCILAAAVMLPAAGLILAAGLAVAGLAVPTLAARWSRDPSTRLAAARAQLSSQLVELLRAAPEIVAFGAAGSRAEAAAELDRELAALARRDAVRAGLADALVMLVAGLTTAGVLAAAVQARAGGSLDPVLVVTVTLLALAAFEAVTPVPRAARELAVITAAGRRVLDLTSRRPLITDPGAPLPPPPRDATIELAGVTARYPGAPRTVIEQVDLRLEPGARVALVGPSGSGKTTVTNLLLRFLDPEQGALLFDGNDARDHRQTDIRAMFSLAGQGAHLFNSTIRQNLLLARPDATDDELGAVLARARLADWVEGLPDGIDTLVGEEGRRLSGGQRQRLVLARALLRDAPVLVLDEPTAHLDAATAEALMADVFAAAGDAAVLLITHRSEGLDAVDQVVTLDAGRATSAAI